MPNRKSEKPPETLRIPFACPRCGEAGSIRVNGLKKMIRCKRCDTVFHIDSRQHVVLGLPEVEHPRKGKPASYFRADKTPIWLQRILQSLTPLHVAILVCVVATLVVFALLRLRQPQDGDLPTTLEGRATLFSQAYRDEDNVLMRRLTHPESANLLDPWLKVAKKMVPKPAGNPEVLFANRVDNLACIALENRQNRGSGARNLVEVLLFWRLSDDRVWQFDAARTLREMGRKDLQ
jgi:hypothetical protein